MAGDDSMKWLKDVKDDKELLKVRPDSSIKLTTIEVESEWIVDENTEVTETPESPQSPPKPPKTGKKPS